MSIRRAAECHGGYRADFFSGVQPLCQWFKSATVLLRASGPSPAMSDRDHLRAVRDWLTDYNAWYRFAGGAKWPPALRMRLLYHRELWAVGDIANLEALRSLSVLGPRLGMAFAYTFDAADFARHEDTARQLGAQRGLAIASIRIGGDAPLALSARLEDFVLFLIGRGVNVSFVGPVDRLRAFRLLENPLISSTVVRVVPTGANARSGAQAPPSPAGPPVPCSGLFRLYVSRSGGVFPCAGLVDVRAASLGSVYEPFADSVLAGRPTGLDLAALARRGPALESARHSRADGRRRLHAQKIPAQCGRHRSELTGGEQPEAPSGRAPGALAAKVKC